MIKKKQNESNERLWGDFKEKMDKKVNEYKNQQKGRKK